MGDGGAVDNARHDTEPPQKQYERSARDNNDAGFTSGRRKPAVMMNSSGPRMAEKTPSSNMRSERSTPLNVTTKPSPAKPALVEPHKRDLNTFFPPTRDDAGSQQGGAVAPPMGSERYDVRGQSFLLFFTQ